jgi:hypothetical protein
MIEFESAEHYALGKLLIHIKRQCSKKVAEARNIWALMSVKQGAKCDYWLERIAWERCLSKISNVDIIRSQGQSEICFDMFKKNLKKIVDDPVRFGKAYLAFLTEEGMIQDLNIGHMMVRKLIAQHTTYVRPIVKKN